MVITTIATTDINIDNDNGAILIIRNNLISSIRTNNNISIIVIIIATQS